MQRILLLLLLILSLSLTTLTQACCCDDDSDPGLKTDIDFITPDFPLNRFLEGRLGIISPKMGTSYLLTAYRYLNHQPLTQDEKSSLMEFWVWYFSPLSSYILNSTSYKENQLLTHYDLRYDYNHGAVVNADTLKNSATPPPIAELQKQFTSLNQDYINWRQACLLALKQKDTNPPLVLNPQEIKTPKDVGVKVMSYYEDLSRKENGFFLNEAPLGDGMNTVRFATLRLQKLAEQVHDPLILTAWINTQKELFKQLKEYEKPDIKTLSQAIAAFPADLPPLAKAEKNYFLAAENFYSSDPKLIFQAADQFAVLAADKSYPFHEWTDYLANRSRALAIFQQQAQRLKRGEDTELDAFAYTAEERNELLKARQNLQSLSIATKDPALKRAAQKYADLITNRIETVSAARLLDKMSTKINFDDLKNQLFMRTFSTNFKSSTSDEALLDKLNSNTTILPTISDWLTLYKMSASAKLFMYSFQQWQLHPDHTAWLLVATNALSFAKGKERTDIIQAIQRIPETETGYLTLRASLLQQDDKLHFWNTDLRKNFIDTTLKTLSNNEDFRSSIFFLSERAALTNSTNDLLQHAFFHPGKVLLLFYPARTSNVSYALSAYNDLLQGLPLSTLVKLSKSTSLPDNYRRTLLSTLWIRSILLNNSNVENAVGPSLAPLAPELTPFIKASASSHTIENKQLQLVSALLHFHFLSPAINLTVSNTWNPSGIIVSTFSSEDHHDPYWWQPGVLFNFGKDFNRPLTVEPTPFLTNAEKAEFLQERSQLHALPNGIEWIVNTVIKLADKHPNDQRYAELLALSVQATHNSLYPITPGLSRRAFVLLKKQYPKNLWAQKTKYYY